MKRPKRIILTSLSLCTLAPFLLCIFAAFRLNQERSSLYAAISTRSNERSMTGGSSLDGFSLQWIKSGLPLLKSPSRSDIRLYFKSGDGFGIAQATRNLSNHWSVKIVQ
jgi:hypothetical protein